LPSDAFLSDSGVERGYVCEMTANDLDLLRKFTRDQSQDAFTTIVRRHLDLVYCAALRQVRSPELAEEVAQSVFSDLARDAARLKPDTVLTAWLYEVTRRTAINVVRGEARRRLREQIACEMNAMNATAADWTQVEPLLDEAMHALEETDRTAVLLRYFENKSLREVGKSLGTSDDTAQKRVSRAVERLREFFTKRGVTVGASGLVLVITANAVQAAPTGLAFSISTTAALAGTTIATTATTAATKAITVTTMQKILVVAMLATTAVGIGIHHFRPAHDLRYQVQKTNNLLTIIGIVVTNIGLRTVSAEQVSTNIQIKVGDTYNRATTDLGVRNLYGTGLFSNVRVNEERTDKGIILMYFLQERPRLAAIRIRGTTKHTEAELLRVLTCKAGELLDERKLFNDSRALQKLCQDTGHSRAKVKFATEVDDNSGLTVATFDIIE
jgi:RNA polymerase sigma factor (sigma-70 family)